ncbi:guanylate kinase [Acetivibrio saccincola]|jgi:guanylate kinase|uniref:Guanylate kinase n=1 Tax=Acetivibrio saccincola TaxID=1677857 RepID=A0A2K9EIU8_9FIRM|nr:guanylate kinase [Acetivibrio saccincola]AUG56441.1 Guanylate kinase [Acetivibrio saccincola]NLW27728.1 guanylate kinase [Acetivibrio saccincola]PQQ66528.1 guanylate kinase [Acetivibrio saccincola]HOA96952.1 guanylate kinase [Acetivibrio saccincola]HQD28463.1 guanylate kinase [Acetivibrio saccincola]
MLVILSGSSGVGKNTVINKISKENSNIELMPTMTTREMRPGEEPGKPYTFVTKEEFEQMIKNEELLEYQIVHGYYYGTPKKVVEEKLKSGKVLIKDIDVDGTQVLVKKLPKVVTIFIKPASKEQLIERLKSRGETRIETRIARYEYEEEMSKNYQYIVINDKLEEAVAEIKNIIDKEYKKLNSQN